MRRGLALAGRARLTPGADRAYNATMQTRASRTSIRRRARPARRPATLKKRIKTLFVCALLACCLGLVFGAVYFVTIFYQVSRNLPSLAEIGNFKPSEG